jgi:protease IV
MLAPIVSNTLRAALFPFLYLRRRSAVPAGSWVELDLDGAVTELERPPPRFRAPREVLLGAPASVRAHTTVARVRELFEAIAADGDVEGVILRVRGLECGWAVATSLREAIAKLRAAGRLVVAYLPDGASTREYFVATASDRIVATPQSTVAPLGVAAGITFVRGLLARGGIEAEVFARREYKSAAEAFTRDSYSEANRRQTEALLDRFHQELVRAIASGRKVGDDTARRWIDEGPWRAVDAARESMIDATAYDDELPRHLGASKEPRRIPAGAYLALARSTRFRPWRTASRVGVVEVRGPIVTEARMAFGAVADARRIVGALRAARANANLGAVVLHIDTRGGSALASDLIAREVDRLREKKPVVAYFADVAASGGYYAGALAHEIVAQPTTVTGSIGVIALRFAAARTLEKLSLTHEVIRRGERADLMSPYRAWSDGDRAAFDREIDGFYGDFVGIVARGRKRDAADIEPLARGRVYAGADAHAAGLVDHLGGLDLALERAKMLAGGRFEALPTVVTPPWKMPDPAEPPAAARALLAALGGAAQGRGALDLLTLMVSSNEHLFAWEELIPAG